MADKVTVVPELKLTKDEEQPAPQLMPEGELLTVPLPLLLNESMRVPMALNVADTDLSAVMESVQVLPEPAHAPDQPANTLLASAAAVKVTDEFCVNAAVQTEPQLMPAGELVTLPLPVPRRETVTLFRVSLGHSQFFMPAK